MPEPRFCPVCKLALRAHDPGWQVQVLKEHVQFIGMGAPQGAYSVCHECYQRMYPDYPIRLHVPRPQLDYMGSFYCSACKTYAREDDPIGQNFVIRVAPEDIADPEQHPELKDLLSRRASGVVDEDGELIAPENRVGDKEIGDWLEKHCGIRHGVIRACQDCRAKLAPAVHARLIRQRVLKKTKPLSEVMLNFNAV